MAGLAAGRGGWVVTPNLEILRRLTTEPALATLVAPADLRLADGMPLIWASRLQRTPLPARVAGSDLIWSLTGRAARDGRSVFLLGGNPGAAEHAAAEFARRFPGLRVAGHHCPPMGFEKDPGQLAALEALLLAACPDIVYVGLGSPKQEHLITRLRPLLPAAWFLGIGISFSFVTGEVRRAPRWMQACGLEWAHRLVQEPRRLAKRYLVHGLPFAARLLLVSAWRGFRGRAPAQYSSTRGPGA
ncbi:MAG: WecB/TagA/CpsF family glycosyltransferase [Phycisphaerales bacterium]|nr:WecB/TagA/CpsF family glycosyltransferase [Phycisphaerales bacterium]